MDKDRDRDRNQDDRKSKFRKRKRKVCIFCVEKSNPDYKNLDLMRRFITERGKIMPRRGSGCCAKHQRRIAMAVKRSRHLGLLPFSVE